MKIRVNGNEKFHKMRKMTPKIEKKKGWLQDVTNQINR